MKTKKNKVKLIDVIHLYLGQRISSYWGDQQEIQTLKGILGTTGIIKMNGDEITESVDLAFKQKKGFEVKLVLGSLSDLKSNISKLMAIHFFNTDKDGIEKDLQMISDLKYDPLKCRYDIVNMLIYEGYDVFGLIESGQAIDVKTL